MRARWLAGALLALAAMAAMAMQPAAAQAAPQGLPVTDEVVRDAEFGVTARHFGLERRVAMYQWARRGTGYARVWSEAPIDSSGFDPGHANPRFPLEAARWLAPVAIDGRPLDEEAMRRVGEWRVFRPNFSALPGNLAATFQPEGDGLGSAENPLAPEVGDLRIHWRELVLPPLEGRVELRDGRWRLRTGADREARVDAVDPPTPWRWWPWALALIGVLLGLGLLRRLR
jgi:hypothetical protein